MKTILIATDFSKAGDNACKYAIALARRSKSRIILLHAFETPMVYSNVPFVTAQLDLAIVHDAEAAKLRKYYRKISSLIKGLQVEMILQQGLASARIREIALEKKADLIVLGTTGKGAMKRVFIGSTAAQLIRNAPCQVLAIPPKAKFTGMKKIVFATDMLEENLKHTKELIPFARSFNAAVQFLHVNTNLTFDEKQELGKLRNQIKKYFKYVKSSAHVFQDPNVADGIGFYLRKNKADCIAMYAHHRSPFNIFKLSNTQELSILTKIPILVIHQHDFADHSSR